MATKKPSAPTKTYVVTHGPVQHNGDTLNDGDPIELTDQQAAGLRGFVELIKEDEAATPKE